MLETESEAQWDQKLRLKEVGEGSKYEFFLDLLEKFNNNIFK